VTQPDLLAATFYYMRDGQRFGPAIGSKIKELVSSGQLCGEDMVWKEGMATWAPASQFPDFFPSGFVAAMPPPTPPDALLGGGVIGAIAGLCVGYLSTVLVLAIIEWMCQMLIAQGELIDVLKRKGKE
jgi:hypothetical protein